MLSYKIKTFHLKSLPFQKPKQNHKGQLFFPFCTDFHIIPSFLSLFSHVLPLTFPDLPQNPGRIPADLIASSGLAAITIFMSFRVSVGLMTHNTSLGCCDQTRFVCCSFPQHFARSAETCQGDEER